MQVAGGCCEGACQDVLCEGVAVGVHELRDCDVLVEDEDLAREFFFQLRVLLQQLLVVTVAVCFELTNFNSFYWFGFSGLFE